MKSPNIPAVFVLALLSFEALVAQSTSGPSSRPRRGDRDRSGGNVTREYAGTIEFGEVESKLLGEPVKYGAYLPPGYKDPANAGKKYPIIFFLHGLWESADRWINGRGGAVSFDNAIKEKLIPPVILLIPDAGTSFYSDTLDGKRPYARFFIEEFVPFGDKTFRTTGRRAERLIAGNSMGGFGALKFAFQHPELFAVVGAHSPAILTEDPNDDAPWARRTFSRLQQRGILDQLFGKPIDVDKWKASNPIALANTAKFEPPVGIYFDCGEEDEYEFDEGCRALDAALTKRKIPHEFAIRPGDHGWAYIRSAMPHLIKFFDTYLKTLKP